LKGEAMPLESQPIKGIVHVPSKFTVSDTLQRLESVVTSHGLTVFARIDFSGDAAKVALQMRPTQLLIFGNSKAGTPLMIVSPSIAIDLPLKALAWQDETGRVWLSYNTPEYLKNRHGLPDELVRNIAAIGELVENAAGCGQNAGGLDKADPEI
jgi:uncharacterized protein (DUF302 family)